MDIDAINPGDDFVKAIETSVGSCDVLIAVIGKRWLTASDKEGRRRLDDPKDVLRGEIATALERGIPVIPVLVDGASMPQSSELPEDLEALAGRSALEVSNTRFRADSEALIHAVEHAFGRHPLWWKQWAGLSAGVIVVLVAAILLYNGLQLVRTTPTPKPPVVTPSQTPPFPVIDMESTPPVIGMDALPMIATTALHVVELGLDVAFITSQQSQSMAGAMPPGAQVMKIESSGAAAKAGINAGDIVEAIGSQRIDTLEDLRKSFRELGPGKTQFTISRSGVRKTILVDCPDCQNTQLLGGAPTNLRGQ